MSYDRFIVDRSRLEGGISAYKIQKNSFDPKKTPYAERLDSVLFDGRIMNQRILPVFAARYKPQPPKRNKKYTNHQIKSDTTLDACGISEDFYKNVLDWSSKDQIAVILGSKVFLYDVNTKQTAQLKHYDLEFEPCSVAFHADSRILAVGRSNGKIDLVDVETARTTDFFFTGRDSILALEWSGQTIGSGGEDGKFTLFDSRRPVTKVEEHRNHRGKCCGIKASSRGIWATGGNDDTVVLR